MTSIEFELSTGHNANGRLPNREIRRKKKQTAKSLKRTSAKQQIYGLFRIDIEMIPFLGTQYNESIILLFHLLDDAFKTRTRSGRELLNEF